MSLVEDFLSKTDEQEIVEAIKIAEQNTSGEIRVHLESSTKKDHFKRALEVFYQLKMHKTRNRNGVLIYVAVVDHKFVILGDEGINKLVASDFWDCTKDIIQNHFQKGEFKQGLINGVLRAGEQLKKYFPFQTNAVNELSNEISKG